MDRLNTAHLEVRATNVDRATMSIRIAHLWHNNNGQIIDKNSRNRTQKIDKTSSN
jgi:hypothetical protein